jgi:hypothetical protein
MSIVNGTGRVKRMPGVYVNGTGRVKRMPGVYVSVFV